IPVEVVPSEVGERHLLSVYVFLLLAHSRDVPVGVARKESCEHGVHLALHRRPCRKRTGFSPLTVRPCGQPRKPASAEWRTLAEPFVLESSPYPTTRSVRRWPSTPSSHQLKPPTRRTSSRDARRSRQCSTT